MLKLIQNNSYSYTTRKLIVYTLFNTTNSLETSYHWLCLLRSHSDPRSDPTPILLRSHSDPAPIHSDRIGVDSDPENLWVIQRVRHDQDGELADHL